MSFKVIQGRQSIDRAKIAVLSTVIIVIKDSAC